VLGVNISTATQCSSHALVLSSPNSTLLILIPVTTANAGQCGDAYSSLSRPAVVSDGLSLTWTWARVASCKNVYDRTKFCEIVRGLQKDLCDGMIRPCLPSDDWPECCDYYHAL